MYLLCYPLVLRNKYTDEITYIYTSNLCGDIINLQMDAMDMTWILMAPSSKCGYENICHRQSIGTYFLILAHMEVFSELSAGCTGNRQHSYFKDLSDPLNSLNSMNVLPHLRKKSIVSESSRFIANKLVKFPKIMNCRQIKRLLH